MLPQRPVINATFGLMALFSLTVQRRLADHRFEVELSCQKEVAAIATNKPIEIKGTQFKSQSYREAV
jgi:hypothetical protein